MLNNQIVSYKIFLASIADDVALCKMCNQNDFMNTLYKFHLFISSFVMKLHVETSLIHLRLILIVNKVRQLNQSPKNPK